MILISECTLRNVITRHHISMLWVVLQFVLQMSDMIPILINLIITAFNYSSILGFTIHWNLENNSKTVAVTYMFKPCITTVRRGEIAS